MNTLFFDKFTLITSLIFLLLGILTPMLSPFFRFKKRENYRDRDTDGPVVLPPLSIILTPYDDADKLRKNLPALLQQDYPAGYQVIIVIEQGDHEAEGFISEVMGQVDMGQSDAEVYVTCIPRSSRYISKKKLAITLGVKAAKYEWMALTEASCRPASPHWLACMARHCSEATNLVVGYGQYEAQTADFRRYERLRDSFYLLRETVCGTAYRTNSHNLLFRKSEFMAQDGYLGNLHLMRGEYDFLVNKYARKGSTVLEISDEAWMVEDEPTDKTWLNRHLFYMESRKYLERGTIHRLLFNIDQAALHLPLLLMLGGIVYGLLTANWVLLAASAIAFLADLVFRIVLIHKALKSFCESISLLKTLFFEISMVYRNLAYLIRYHLADKNEFTTHKL